MKIADMRAPRLRAPRGARRGSPVFFRNIIPDPPGGHPVGAAATIVIGSMGISNPVFSLNLFDFHKKRI
jgi:hypothetical protein